MRNCMRWSSIDHGFNRLVWFPPQWAIDSISWSGSLPFEGRVNQRRMPLGGQPKTGASARRLIYSGQKALLYRSPQMCYAVVAKQSALWQSSIGKSFVGIARRWHCVFAQPMSLSLPALLQGDQNSTGEFRASSTNPEENAWRQSLPPRIHRAGRSVGTDDY
jgi:hypothetical protein